MPPGSAPRFCPRSGFEVETRPSRLQFEPSSSRSRSSPRLQALLANPSCAGQLPSPGSPRVAPNSKPWPCIEPMIPYAQNRYSGPQATTTHPNSEPRRTRQRRTWRSRRLPRPKPSRASVQSSFAQVYSSSNQSIRWPSWSTICPKWRSKRWRPSNVTCVVDGASPSPPADCRLPMSASGRQAIDWLSERST